MTAVALIEDDERLRRALALTLRARGHEVFDVASGAAALELLTRRRVDVVILDLGLPDIDGIEVIRTIRETDDLPIVVLSARRDQSDKVAALDAGADDYLTKPFGVDELLARLRAAVRRAGRGTDDRVVSTPNFVIDLGRKTVENAEHRVHLTPTEWGVLETLVRANGLLVTAGELLGEVWGPAYATQTNYLRVYLSQLRHKLEPDPTHPRYLITRPGHGHHFDASGNSGN